MSELFMGFHYAIPTGCHHIVLYRVIVSLPFNDCAEEQKHSITGLNHVHVSEKCNV